MTSSLTFTQADVQRFLSHVDVLPCGCWFWTGARSRGKGNLKWYGSFWLPEHGTVRAHRFAELLPGGPGPMPEGYHRDHTCVFSLCVFPGHVEHVTPEENQRRKLAAGGRRGEIERLVYLAASRALTAQPSPLAPTPGAGLGSTVK